MAKECPITINNEAVTVCQYDETLIQFPSIHDMKAKTVSVTQKNGRYYVASEHDEAANQPKETTEPKNERGLV